MKAPTPVVKKNMTAMALRRDVSEWQQIGLEIWTVAKDVLCPLASLMFDGGGRNLLAGRALHPGWPALKQAHRHDIGLAFLSVWWRQ